MDAVASASAWDCAELGDLPWRVFRRERVDLDGANVRLHRIADSSRTSRQVRGSAKTRSWRALLDRS
jgi:hypothetical protein